MAKCYFCGKQIDDKWDLVEKKIPLVMKNGKKRNYRRTFHANCVRPFMIKFDEKGEYRKKENDDWKRCAEYFCKVTGTDHISQYAVTRLLGLYNGTFTQAGKNTRGSHRGGYTYEEIYYALVFSTIAIQNAMKQSFNNHEHFINYIMKIIWGNIDTVRMQLNSRKQTEQALESEKLDANNPVADYKRKGGHLSDFNNLAKLIEENENDDLDELFGGD